MKLVLDFFAFRAEKIDFLIANNFLIENDKLTLLLFEFVKFMYDLHNTGVDIMAAMH